MSKKAKEAKAEKREKVKQEVLAKISANALKIRELNKLKEYDKANELAAENKKLRELIK